MRSAFCVLRKTSYAVKWSSLTTTRKQTMADENGKTTAGPETVSIDTARDVLGDLVLRSGFRDERIVISRHGKPLAALVGLADLKRLQESDATVQSSHENRDDAA